MINIKEKIAKEIEKTTKLNSKELESYIEKPKEAKNGDYAFPCFKLAKELKKAPQQIAQEIASNINISKDIIEKVEVVGGYLNFYANKNLLTNEVIKEISSKEKVGSSNIGNGKTIVIDYSSPNIAKPFHIGHLKTTVLGGALYNIYKHLGYKVIGVNHLGDYGTQFGKLIEGYKRWGDEYDLTKDPIDKLAEIYLKINNLCAEDEDVLNKCRENFKLLENGDEYCTKLWNKFRDLSIKEFQKIYDMLGSKFDSWNGEAFYADKTSEVIDILSKTGRLVESEGAMVIDLSKEGIDTPCIICKSNGSTIYATRDLAAILYRARTYNYDKSIYVTSYEQNLHFKQIFEVAKLLGLDEKYTKGLEHVSYGMIRLPSGKMSTRKGNFIKVEDIIKETINEAKKIIEEKNPSLEDKEEVAKRVGIGAIIFNNVSTNRVKDEIFDINEMLNFQGETGPYIQYTYVRTNSVLKKVANIPDAGKINVNNLQDEYSQNIIKLIADFENILIQVTKKEEVSILAKYLIELSKAFSSFYNENKIIGEESEVQDARVYLTYCVNKVLKTGAELLGIKMPEKM
ncbi:arginine--tRNA ligase [Clostridium sp. CAG:440]|nr:arginine--tRNA ligase [Clostridium sp. CAG:440]